MASITYPQNFFLMLWKGEHAFATDNLKLSAMSTSYTFDRDNDISYSDISGDELATANGYTTGGAAVTVTSIAVNDTDNTLEVDCANIQWTASGGSLSTGGYVMWNDSTSIAGGDTTTDAVVAFLDPETTITAADGEPLLVKDIQLVTQNG